MKSTRQASRDPAQQNDVGDKSEDDKSDDDSIDDEISNIRGTATAYINAFTVAGSTVPIPNLSATQVALWAALSTTAPFPFEIKLKSDLVLADVTRELLKSEASDQDVLGKIVTWILSKSLSNQNKILNDLSDFIRAMTKDREGKKSNEREGLLRKEMTKASNDKKLLAAHVPLMISAAVCNSLATAVASSKRNLRDVVAG